MTNWPQRNIHNYIPNSYIKIIQSCWDRNYMICACSCWRSLLCCLRCWKKELWNRGILMRGNWPQRNIHHYIPISYIKMIQSEWDRSYIVCAWRSWRRLFCCLCCWRKSYGMEEYWCEATDFNLYSPLYS